MADNNSNSERLTIIEGVLDRLVFASDKSDFIVARITVGGRREPVTIVGNLPQPHPGETVILEGRWEFDKKFGEQFKFQTAQSKAPSTIEAVTKYLASKMIKGIGPEMAKRITAAFGDETLDVIENDPAKLRTVSGIGPMRAEKISEAFRSHKSIRQIMLFLQTHGLSPTYAYKIHKAYGNESVAKVASNPYRLATDIRGIGFRSADKVAGSLGIDMRSPLRAKAGILHVLDEMQSEGHVYYPLPQLLDKSRELLGIEAETLKKSVVELCESQHLTIEKGSNVYLSQMAVVENSVASKLRDLMTAPRFLPPLNVPAALDWISRRKGIQLSEAQKRAVAAAFDHKVVIITGGPGTGKTTLLRALIDIMEAKKLRVLLAAPTGRAAKRLSEAADREAKTIHRLLEYSPGAGFLRNRNRNLEAEVIIIDEMSMVDINLMHYLLGALNSQATLILVGDADQLPSVGPGNVLSDMIDSGKLHTVRLQTVFRQASSSLIVTNAHLVNKGSLPLQTPEKNTLSDFYFIEKDNPEESLKLIKEMVAGRIPKRFGLDPIQDIQVLSPMHKGILGTENLNRELRDVLNPAGRPIKGDRFRIGDRVMQIRNNYEKETFNGDIGRIVLFDDEWDEIAVDFEGRQVRYHVSELDELVPAYATTIHKSQGSEYRSVLVPLSTQHYVLLRRNLLYTAMTRGKDLVVLLGSSRALEIAVENRIVEPRYTDLMSKI